MTKLLNSAGTQYYANKMCNADNRKVGNKSLTTALTDIDNLIDEMKVHFDKEYGSSLSMDISNNTNSFSIGAGINIDKKNEVENSFTAIGLSGNSLVNCLFVDKLYEESNYLEFENSPIIAEDKITLKSKKADHVRFCPKMECGIIKPNTQYTLIFDVTSNNLTGTINLTHTNANNLISPFPTANSIQSKQTGIFKYVLTSKQDISDCTTLLRTVIWDNCNAANETITFSLMILEGNWANKPLPRYFKGLKSIGENGLSLYSIPSKLNLIRKGYTVPSPGIHWNTYGETNFEIVKDNNCPNGSYIKITSKNTLTNKSIGGYTYPKEKLTVGKQYSWSVWCKTNKKMKIRIGAEQNGVLIVDADTTWKKYSNTFIANDSTHWAFILYLQNPEAGDYIQAHSLKIEEGDTISEWCPHKDEIFENYVPSYSKLDKKEVALDKPLRGLPNGIKDTIEKVNGEWKIVRRCGELTINPADIKRDGNGVTGDFRWIMANNSDIANLTQTSIVHVLCNKYPSTTSGSTWGSAAEGMAQNNNGNRILLFLNKYKEGSEENKTNLKKEIGNDTKVIYQLTTPVIEDIDPITLQCWKNGTILIDETLPVESTHEIALNKAAQIKNNMEELVSLKKKVQNLEKQYDQIALEQAHQLSLLKHSYEVDYDI